MITKVPLLTDCARCGQTHKDLQFNKLTHAIETQEVTFTHWCPCPINGEPIVMWVIEDNAKVENHE